MVIKYFQLVWANTWKMGCGYMYYYVENPTDEYPKWRKYYGCNYIPG